MWKLRVQDDDLGFMADETVAKMPWTSKFRIDKKCIRIVDTSEGKDTAKAASTALQEVIDQAIATNLFPKVLHGKHSELYRIVIAQGNLEYERFSTSLWGLVACGVYLVAYECSPNNRVSGIWIQRRGSEISNPGLLDVTAAGGIRAGGTSRESISTEAKEEASLDLEEIDETRPTGRITYVTRHPVTRLLYSCWAEGYELELHGTKPEPGSNEVAEFMLMSVTEVQDAMFNGEFRPGCDLLLIDFFMRHDIIKEADKDYDILKSLLHSPLPQGLAL